MSYPEQAVTSEQLTLLRGAEIWKSPLPRFTKTAVLRNGGIVIRGKDEIIFRWLFERIEYSSPRKGAKLRVMGLDALQKWHRAAVWVPDFPMPVATILGLLEKQNPGIATFS